MRTPVGLDLGKGFIKYITATDQGDQLAWLASGRISSIFGSGNGTGAVRYKGHDYITGRAAILGTGFTWSSTEHKDETRNLIFTLAVLGKLGLSEADVVTGLPVSQVNSPAVNRVKSLLAGKHEVVVNDKPRIIDISISVLAEPLGTYFSLVLNAEGHVTASPYLSQLIGILDIGYRTIDIVALDGGELATAQDSTLSGVATLFEQIAKLIEADHGKLRANEIDKVHTWLTSGCRDRLMIAGKYVREDLVAEIARLRLELAGRIIDEAGTVLSTIRPDKLIFTGGGAALLRAEILRIKPEVMIHNNPRMANTIGFYRAALGRVGHASR